MKARMAGLWAAVGMFGMVLGAAAGLKAQADGATRQFSLDIFKQLIEINTTDSVGSTTVAAQAMAKRLLDAGFPASDVQVLGPNDRKGNMVARLHGTGEHRPILFIGHLDVVEALRSDWTTDPFQFVEKDGFYYGRGTNDMKSEDALMVTTFIRLKKEGYKPDRDLILALTADEEGGKSNGVDWLLKNHRDLVDAEFVINPDGGGVTLEDGKPVILSVDATQKLYADFQLEAINRGGHSSLPKPDNAIYQLADALTQIQHYQFPFELNAITREFFERRAKEETGRNAEDMLDILKMPPDQEAIARLSTDAFFNATMRTTCVATRLEGGHANNALPQTARANINCRILPGHSREEIRQTLVHVINDRKVAVRWMDNDGVLHDTAPDAVALPPVAMRPEVLKPLEAAVNKIWPGTPVVPSMATGASDSIYTNAAGMPSYDVGAIAIELGDDRSHGKDERIPVKSYDEGIDFLYMFMKGLAPAQ